MLAYASLRMFFLFRILYDVIYINYDIQNAMFILVCFSINRTYGARLHAYD